ncbi:class I adenylate-forming enzyme family protein [Petroclostridium xylanilyticum]|uniref:class I adenylate-forming enzyme family protein n=1 Tax=Petroclostridium xylanilyticum TaxID=1792311 RepID=UPI0018E2B2EF|nr:AMP-binding protein [Petroclostridium xylanilyticum]
MNSTDIGVWPLNIVQGMIKEVYNNIEYDVFEEKPDNLYMSLVNTANLYPDKLALIEQNRKVTFREFKELVDIVASNLYSIYDVRKGDRVALLMVNSIDFCVSFYALAKLGSISVPLSTKSKSTELIHPLKDSGAKILILNEQWWKNVKDIIHLTSIEYCIISGSKCCRNINGKVMETLYKKEEAGIGIEYDLPKAHDPAVIMYTSGTTGSPKGALLSHFNILHGVISYKRIFNLSSDDSTIIAIPIFHITGLAALLALFVHIGGTIYLLPYFDAQKVLDVIKTNHITFLHGSPTVFILLLEQSRNFGELKSLKKAACGSANMPPEVLAKIKRWLTHMDFHTVYGLTETSSPATVFPTDVYSSSKIGSSGLPIPGLEIKIVDEQGNQLSPNEVGELLVKGPVVLEKYWNNTEATANSIKDGWFKTGDLAKIDDDGYIYILDRKKDMINRGGEKVYCLEVENVLYDHPAIKEVAVIGVPDSVYGEVVKAVIVLNKGCTLTEKEIREWMSKRLAKYKIPQYIQFIDDMPRTDNGKISKKLIREIYG